jgi:hypothetical protein
MSCRHLLHVVAAILAVSSPAWAIDYSEIERTLNKEPAYASKTREYALLVFGPEADVRVWVVLDGETVYLDGNADGDLTGKDERFEKAEECKNVEIADPDGQTRYIVTRLNLHKQQDPPRTQMMAYVDINGPVGYQQYCDAAMEENPEKAAIAHFHGPLTIGPRTINWKVPPELSLAVGEKAVDLYAMIGTMSAEYGCWVVVATHHGDKAAFAEGVVPVVDVEFLSSTPGAARLKKRYTLDKFC